jgi:hypothetical protein
LGVHFIGGTLSGVSFRNAHLRCVRFEETDLRSVDFSGTTFELVDIPKKFVRMLSPEQRAHLGTVGCIDIPDGESPPGPAIPQRK